MNDNKTRRSFLGRAVMLLITAAIATVKTPLAFAAKTSAGLGRLTGEVIDRTHRQYEAWRASMVWYLIKDKRYPDIIVRAKTGQDVINAVNYARERGLKISVRSTGHHINRVSLRNGGMLLDLAELNRIEVNPSAMEAWVQPAARSLPFIEEISRYHLGFPAAHSGMVGMGGYLLGGGIGWNQASWDLACRNVLETEIVTADGRKVIASETENQDLLWAVRGAGPGFFGVVLRYKLRLHPLPKHILNSSYLLPDAELEMVSSELERLCRGMDNRIELLAMLRHASDIPGMAGEGLACMVNIYAFGDTREESLRLLQPFAQSRLSEQSVMRQENGLTSILKAYDEQQTGGDAESVYLTSADNVWTDEPVKAFMIAAGQLRSSPTNRNAVITSWGAEVKDRQDTAAPRFADNYVVFYAMSQNESDVEPNYSWVAETSNALQAVTRGRHINETELRRMPWHAEDCFNPEGWRRLASLRNKYDPDKVFHAYINHE